MRFTFSLLILNLYLTMTSCCHSDKNEDHRSRVNCTGMSLSNVPSDIDQATEVIVLTDNQFESLSWTSYERFRKLHELDLSHNKVSSLEKMPDLIIPSLRVLHLTGNKLQELPASAFIAVSNVMEIYLRENQLHTLNEDTFKDLKKLEVLDLSQNLIQVLPSKLLTVIATKSLKKFDVEDNRLKVMPNKFFPDTPEIAYVYLSKNPWVCDCNVGYLTRWLEDQGHNVYVHTGPSKFVNDPESVLCDSPSRLKARVIMDLTEEEYCSTASLGDIDPIEISAQPTTTAISRILLTTHVLPSTQTASVTQTNATSPQGITITPNLTKTTASIHISTTRLIPTISTTHTTTDTFSLLTEKMYSYYLTWTSWYEYHATKYVIHKTVAEIGMDAEHTTTSTAFLMTTVPTNQYTSILPSTPPTSTAHHPTTTDPTWTTKQSLITGYAGLKRPAVYYCWWLYFSYLSLCILLIFWLCTIFLWSLRAYLKVYLPLSRKKQQRTNTLRLLGYPDRQIEGNGDNARWTGKAVNRAGAISLPLEGAGGVQAMFRSVLFVHRTGERKEREGEECDTVKSENTERADGPGTSQECMIGEGTGRAENVGGEKGEVHRKIVFKVISREEEITGLSDADLSQKANSRNPNEQDENVTQGWSESNRRNSELKKRYSLILREERVEGEEEARSRSRDSAFWNEWVVGEWLLKDRGGRDTGEEDWWSLMPLIARAADLEPRGGDSSTATNIITSETHL